MIKLLVSSSSTSTVTHSFNQPSIVIGSAVSSEVDLSLKDPSLEACHLKICEEAGRFYAINISNDPFATVNDLPFGKKQLQPNDIIEIGSTTIRFIGTPATTTAKPAKPTSSFSEFVDTQETLPPLLDKALIKKTLENKKNTEPSEFLSHTTTNKNIHHFSLPAHDIETFSDSLNDGILEDFDLECIDIDALMNQVEAWDKLAAAPPSFSPVPPAPPKAQPAMFDEKAPSQEKELPLIAADAPITALPVKEKFLTLPKPSVATHPKAQQLATAAIETVETAEEPPLVLAPPPVASKKSLKDYYLSEYDDIQDATQLPLNKNGRPSSASKDFVDGNNWKLLLKIFISLMVITAVIAGLGYLWISDQSEEEEIKAAKSLADVAMALTYAQIKHIRSQNQNWSDPEFIKNNLTAVLASKHASLAEFDTHGQFTNCPYILRIYTSHDLSQFLVLAQPAPSVLQWLIPKATVIIDSHSMEMRKINDLKTLNRLLITANTLDGTSAAEISQLVREGTLISLNELVTPRENQGFSPPKALALIRPGSENLVYNAPRYYHLGEDLMKKSYDLIEKSAGNHEVALLQQEISALSKFPDIVLYSSGGFQQAMQAQKALAVVAPNEKFLIAYLQLTNKGKISSSHLLMDDAPPEIAEAEFQPLETIAENKPTQNAIPSPQTEVVAQPATATQPKHETSFLPQNEITDQDSENPVYIQLSALSHTRQQRLKPISDEIMALLAKNNQSPVPDFLSRFQHLTEKYLHASESQQTNTSKKIAAIVKEHQDVPALQFQDWVKGAGVQGIFRAYLDNLKSEKNFQEPSRALIDQQLTRIENSSSWQELEQEVKAMNAMLSFDHIPDAARLVTYQNATRSRVIQKLNQFLLAPECPLPPEAFDSSQREVLSSVLQTCWVCDPETLEFYLSEFDLRTENKEPAKEKDEGGSRKDESKEPE